ncbi:MAG: hypothetical protein AAFQ00_06670 [Pseudomonadota bacterium]
MLGAMALLSPSIVSADQITLTFEDHGFAVSGEFKTVTNSSYVVITEHGEMTVPMDMVTCEGAACVAPTTILAES